MDTVTITLNVPKEMQEVSVFLVNLVKAIKAKKTPAVIAAEELGDLMAAVEGYDKLSEEVKSAEASDCIALLGSGVFKALK